MKDFNLIENLSEEDILKLYDSIVEGHILVSKNYSIYYQNPTYGGTCYTLVQYQAKPDTDIETCSEWYTPFYDDCLMQCIELGRSSGICASYEMNDWGEYTYTYCTR